MTGWKLLIILTAVLLYSTAAAGEEGSARPYKIGVILPLTGESATWGKYVKQGIDLAMAELLEGPSKVQVIFEDDQWQSARSVNAYHKLITTDGVDGIIVAGSAPGNALAPLAEKAGKLLVSIGASDRSLALGKRYVVIHWVSPDTEAQTMLAEIQRRGYQRLAMVSSEHQGAIALETALSQEMGKAGVGDRLLLKEHVMADMRDFKTLIAKIKSKNCDGIVVCILPGPLGAFMRQARDLGLGSELFAFETFEDANEVRASDGAMIGKWYINVDDATSDFRERYRKRFGEEPGWGSANSYDTIRLIADAAGRFGPDNERIAEAFLKLKDYSGACGTYSSSGDNMFALPLTVKIVTNDGFRRLKDEAR